MEKKADYSSLLQRYEMLKRKYFYESQTRYDEDGEEIIPVISRDQIVAMFGNMGVELPLTPNDEPRFKPPKKN